MATILLPALFLALALAPAVARPQPLAPDERGILTIAPVLERVTDAVVSIAVVSRDAANPLLQDPFFRYFFNAPAPGPVRPQMSAGSGVIVDAARGFVLTNHHVVAGAETVIVTLQDRRELAAELVGSDPLTDIAVLRAPAEALTAIEPGDSDRLKVGDFVVAIGNPFGLGQTVTSGIVSALGRSGINPEGYEDFIQTDASINPGNSGGALITLDGKLVGINTAIVAPAGGNVGIGFAVPVDMALAVMEQIVTDGEVERGWLGVTIQELDPALADALGLAAAAGALIAKVEPGSPAADAGLRAGDVVTAAGGHPVRDAGDLRNVLGLIRPGVPLALELWRDRATEELTVTLEAPDERRGRLAGGPLAGAELVPLLPGQPGLRPAVGVGVARVAPGSPAARLGLRPGDVITSIDNRPVRDPEEVTSALSGRGPITALTLLRDGREYFLVVPG
jgi:Do/DeqQ family serine protease